MTSLSHGFFTVAAASVPLRVAFPAENGKHIVDTVRAAAREGVRLLTLPELCLTGYTCGDLFFQDALQAAADGALREILSATEDLDIITVLGLPVAAEGGLFNCAAVIRRGAVLGVVPKTHLPNYGEFHEKRWFSSGAAAAASSVHLAGGDVHFGTDLLFRAREDRELVFGVDICEDLWVPAQPSNRMAQEGALVICNPSAGNDIVDKHARRRELVGQQSRRCAAAYVYAGAGVHESTTDLVFGGATLIAENGKILAEGERFSRTGGMIVRDVDLDLLKNRRRRLPWFSPPRDGAFRFIPFPLSPGPAESPSPPEPADPPELRKSAAPPGRPERPGPRDSAKSPGSGASPPPAARLRRDFDPRPFVPADPAVLRERCEEVFALQTAALARRLEHTRAKTAVLGVSGGLDSTLALLAAVKTFDLLGRDRGGVIGVTMPGFGTTGKSHAAAREMMRVLGVSSRDIDIKPACLRHFADIGHDPEVHDTTFENVQARERTQILMDIANLSGGLVVGSGDLSELALGWCTFGGDQMSMYGVNSGVPKTLMPHLLAWAADREEDGAVRKAIRAALDAPISPELLPPGDSGETGQRTEDILGPYEVHDFFLYHFVRNGASPEKLLFMALRAFAGTHDEKALRSWLRLFLRRFFAHQFKRSSMPDGPKIGSVGLSPRGDWRMPSDAEAGAWLAGLGDRD